MIYSLAKHTLFQLSVLVGVVLVVCLPAVIGISLATTIMGAVALALGACLLVALFQLARAVRHFRAVRLDDGSTKNG